MDRAMALRRGLDDQIEGTMGDTMREEAALKEDLME